MNVAPPEILQIPAETRASVERGLGSYFTGLNHASPETIARDMLSAEKPLRAYETLCRYVDPKGKKILEIGSGYGISLITWVKQFGLDVIGLEPEGEGFVDTAKVSRELCKANGVPPERVVAGVGEAIPFPDASFDIVYSCNAIEHSQDPVKFLAEALRVLKPGGILHFEMPNFLSYFEGHYYVIMPPLISKSILPWWVKNVHGRDPAFAGTLRTEVNPCWIRRTVAKLSSQYPATILSQGEEVFRDRLKTPFKFQHAGVQGVIGPVINALQRLNFGDLAANIFILLQGHYPIFLTARRD
jgi:ubiquinone/menaquinone biosynthesis C-methylase UbiE